MFPGNNHKRSGPPTDHNSAKRVQNRFADEQRNYGGRRSPISHSEEIDGMMRGNTVAGSSRDSGAGAAGTVNDWGQPAPLYGPEWNGGGADKEPVGGNRYIPKAWGAQDWEDPVAWVAANPNAVRTAGHESWNQAPQPAGQHAIHNNNWDQDVRSVNSYTQSKEPSQAERQGRDQASLSNITHGHNTTEAQPGYRSANTNQQVDVENWGVTTSNNVKDKWVPGWSKTAVANASRAEPMHLTDYVDHEEVASRVMSSGWESWNTAQQKSGSWEQKLQQQIRGSHNEWDGPPAVNLGHQTRNPLNSQRPALQRGPRPQIKQEKNHNPHGMRFAPPIDPRNNWSADTGDWESLRGSDSASNFYPGKLHKSISRNVSVEQGPSASTGIAQGGAVYKHDQIVCNSGTFVKQEFQTSKSPLYEHVFVPLGASNQINTNKKATHQQPVQGNPHPNASLTGSQANESQALNTPPADPTHAQPYRSIMAENLANRYPYTGVWCLFICWEEDYPMFTDLIKDIQSAFTFRYASAFGDIIEIPHTSSYTYFRGVLENFIQEYSDHETLLVIYYIGGAVRTEDDGLALFPLINSKVPQRGAHNYPKIFWEETQTELEEAESDVLILMDTCGRYGDPPSSSGADYEEGEGKTEMIASFETENFDLASMSMAFTQDLVHGLEAFFAKEAVFSVADLHRNMVHRFNMTKNTRPDTQVVPFFMRLNGAPQDSSIMLRPVPWDGEEFGTIVGEECGEDSGEDSGEIFVD